MGATFGPSPNSPAGTQPYWKGIATNLPTASSMLSSGGNYIIYTLIAAVCIGIGIVIVDLFYPFLPVNLFGFGYLSTTARQGNTFWAPKLIGDGQNLIVPAPLSPTIRAGIYSMVVQMAISDSRTPSLGKFRHILHRGSNPCGLTSIGAGSSGHSGIKVSDIPASSYTNDGLPEFMNPGVFLDQYTNDMHIYAHTMITDATGVRYILESTTVFDLPLGQILTLGIVCNQNTLEVYVNCQLYTTLLLKGAPFMSVENNTWFGRYCAFPFLGTVQNLTLWDTPLLATDMIRICRSYSSMNLPQACAAGSADKVINSASSTYTSIVGKYF
jgi:hypothetical protein